MNPITQDTHLTWPTPGTGESESAKQLFLAALMRVEQNTAELNIPRHIRVLYLPPNRK